jgi:hypothetical protein
MFYSESQSAVLGFEELRTAADAQTFKPTSRNPSHLISVRAHGRRQRPHFRGSRGRWIQGPPEPPIPQSRRLTVFANARDDDGGAIQSDMLACRPGAC